MSIDISKKFRFRNFPVYRDARIFAREIHQIARASFPSHERYGLTQQMLNASYSILLNIAEGSDRATDKDFARFLNQALTSLNEVIACIDLALDCGYLLPANHSDILESAAKLGNQLSAFYRTLTR